MPSTVVDDVSRLWAPSAPTVSSDAAPGRRPDQVAMHVSIQSGSAIGAGVASALPLPLDLSSLPELRFWARGYAPADGRPSPRSGWSWATGNAGDAAGDEHTWLVPVDQPGRWEEHRIGLGAERRTAVTEVFLRAITDQPVELTIAPLIAVDEQIPADVAAAVADLVAQRAGQPGPSGTTAVAAAAGASTLITTFEPGLRQATGSWSNWRPARCRRTWPRWPMTRTRGRPPSRSSPRCRRPCPPELRPGHGAGRMGASRRAQQRAGRADPGPRDSAQPERYPRGAVPCLVTAAAGLLPRPGRRDRCSLRPPPLPVALEYQILVLAGDDGQRNRILAGLLPLLRSLAALTVNGVDLPMGSLAPPPRSTATGRRWLRWRSRSTPGWRPARGPRCPGSRSPRSTADNFPRQTTARRW